MSDAANTACWTALSPTGRFTTDNYTHVFDQSGLWNAFLNSLFITIPSTVIPVTIAAFAGYAFAWMTFPGRDILFVVVQRVAVPGEK